MHDIGKIGIPDYILQKPGPLTDEERKEMQKHCVLGARIFGGSGSSTILMAETIALRHHEKWNGTGYPGGLKEKEIPLIARIVAIVDVFDALVSKRPYKKPFSLDKALTIIKEDTGTHFDPEVSKVFFNNIDRINEIRTEYRD